MVLAAGRAFVFTPMRATGIRLILIGLCIGLFVPIGAWFQSATAPEPVFEKTPYAYCDSLLAASNRHAEKGFVALDQYKYTQQERFMDEARYHSRKADSLYLIAKRACHVAQ